MPLNNNSSEPHERTQANARVNTAQASAPTKRSSYRVHFKLTESPQIHIALASGLRCPAWIENLSDRGAFLRLAGEYTEIESDNMIACDIRLDALALPNCDAVVIHRRYVPKLNESKLGVKFWELSSTHCRQLHVLLMKLQRRNIRTDLTL